MAWWEIISHFWILSLDSSPLFSFFSPIPPVSFSLSPSVSSLFPHCIWSFWLMWFCQRQDPGFKQNFILLKRNDCRLVYLSLVGRNTWKARHPCAWSASAMPFGVSSVSVATSLGCTLTSASPGLASSRCSGNAYGAGDESGLHVSCRERWLLLTRLGRSPCICCFIKDFICVEWQSVLSGKLEELV